MVVQYRVYDGTININSIIFFLNRNSFKIIAVYHILINENVNSLQKFMKQTGIFPIRCLFVNEYKFVKYCFTFLLYFLYKKNTSIVRAHFKFSF